MDVDVDGILERALRSCPYGGGFFLRMDGWMGGWVDGCISSV